MDALLQRVQFELQIQQIRNHAALRLVFAIGGLLDLAVVRTNSMKRGLRARCALRQIALHNASGI